VRIAAVPLTPTLELNGVPVVDTFAEAFPMAAARIVVTAATERWARVAATEATGHASSVIACDAEAAIEGPVDPTDTPDGRPGIAILVFAFSKKGLGEALVARVGQNVLTCPTTACFDGLYGHEVGDRVPLGDGLRFFGDGFQSSKKLLDRRFWRIPVMDGEFVCEGRVGTVKGVGGGNLILGGHTLEATLAAAEAAIAAIDELPGVVSPFPGGIVRSGSKVGSRYPKLKASTNHEYCPTLLARTESALTAETRAVYEIVVDGLTPDAVAAAMRAGLHAASRCEGLTLLTAGNYGGQLGPHHFALRDLL
jgi:formylmethanofuran--tetrahydromethanopterin N-formyltransferase